MFKALKAMFVTPDQAVKVADAVIKGADAAWFTKEEQSEWFLRYLEATQPMNVSRRFIAISLTMIWELTAVVLLVLTLMESPKSEAVIEYMATVVGPPFVIILSFYFGKAVAEAWPSRGNEK